MGKALIICHSQTEALKCRRILEGAGVSGTLTKPPRIKGTGSCSWAVLVPWESMPIVRRRLLEKNFTPVRITTPDGGREEG